MLYRFKKNDFFVTYQEKKRGVAVKVARENCPNQSFYLGMITPGNLYMLTGSEWKLIDISGMMHFQRNFQDHIEKASEALSIAITRIPIAERYLKLCYAEFKILEAISYDIVVKRSVNWLETANLYHFDEHKMIIMKSTMISVFPIPQTREQLTGWNPRTDLFPKVTSTPSPGPVNMTRQHKPETPRIVISPAITPASLRSPVPGSDPHSTGPVIVESQLVQKTPSKAKLLIKPDSTKSQISHHEFYSLVERRGKWKRDNPNWRVEMYPNYKDDHERCMRLQKEQREKDRIALEQNVDKTYNNEDNNEDRDENEEEDVPTIVDDDVFVRAAEYIQRSSTNFP